MTENSNNSPNEENFNASSSSPTPNSLDIITDSIKATVVKKNLENGVVGFSILMAFAFLIFFMWLIAFKWEIIILILHKSQFFTIPLGMLMVLPVWIMTVLIKTIFPKDTSRKEEKSELLDNPLADKVKELIELIKELLSTRA